MFMSGDWCSLRVALHVDAFIHPDCVYRFSCVVESKEFHNKSSEEDLPFLYCVLKLSDEQVICSGFALSLRLSNLYPCIFVLFSYFHVRLQFVAV